MSMRVIFIVHNVHIYKSQAWSRQENNWKFVPEKKLPNCGCTKQVDKQILILGLTRIQPDTFFLAGNW